MQKTKGITFEKSHASALLTALLTRWAADHPQQNFTEEKLYWAILSLSQQPNLPFREWDCYEFGASVLSRDLEEYLFKAGAWGQLEWVQKGRDKVFSVTGYKLEAKPLKNVNVDEVYATFKELLKAA